MYDKKNIKSHPEYDRNHNENFNKDYNCYCLIQLRRAILLGEGLNRDTIVKRKG